MGEATKIEWTTHTFNPWIGCTKVHAGCTNCYAEELMDTRYGRVEWGPNGTRSKTSDANWKEPLKWNRQAEKAGERRRVFCASLADVFEDWKGPIVDGTGLIIRRDAGCKGEMVTMDDLRRDLFALIDQTPWLDWLLLTKRPENVRRMWSEVWWPDYAKPDGTAGPQRPNVWLLTSVSDQPTADRMIPELLKCCDLVPVLGISAEPLLGPIQFIEDRLPHSEYEARKWGDGVPENPGLDWVIVGGESGGGSRPCNLAWIRSIVEQCRAAGVACFVKQLGSRPVRPEPYQGMKEYPYSHGKGGDPSEWPNDLRIREFPCV